MLIQHQRHLLKSSRPSETDRKKFKYGVIQEFLTLTQQLSDFGLAINSVPGFLWGGKLKPLQIGLLGIVSSLITIFKLLHIVP